MNEFFEAVKQGDTGTVSRLLSVNPSIVNARDESGATGVQVAVYNFQRPAAAFLVAQGAELDLPSACCLGHLPTVDRLAKTNNPNELSPDGFTPLSLASAFAGPDTVSNLIGNGADVNVRGTALGGVAPIHAAVFGRQNESLDLLLAAGADPNLRQEGGFTALMGAAQNGNEPMVASLLAAGADPAATTDAGKTASDMAEESGHPGCAALLSAALSPM
ncbi:MAG: ankyrin repeat domain-containing protein [Armatimonadetes bacterium]|nr:ankyrin repeat domain-containing protein [Armatimonadota bacterium]